MNSNDINNSSPSPTIEAHSSSSVSEFDYEIYNCQNPKCPNKERADGASLLKGDLDSLRFENDRLRRIKDENVSYHFYTNEFNAKLFFQKILSHLIMYFLLSFIVLDYILNSMFKFSISLNTILLMTICVNILEYFGIGLLMKIILKKKPKLS